MCKLIVKSVVPKGGGKKGRVQKRQSRKNSVKGVPPPGIDEQRVAKKLAKKKGYPPPPLADRNQKKKILETSLEVLAVQKTTKICW